MRGIPSYTVTEKSRHFCLICEKFKSVFQIWVCRSDGTEPLTSCDDSPTRFAGGLPAGRSQRGFARHRRPFTTALPLRYPSRREPLFQPRGNSLPDKWFLSALFRLPPGGSSRPQAGEGVRVHNGFHFLRLSDSPTNPNFPPKNPKRPKAPQKALGRFSYFG